MRIAEVEIEGDPTLAVLRPAPMTLECSLSAGLLWIQYTVVLGYHALPRPGSCYDLHIPFGVWTRYQAVGTMHHTNPYPDSSVSGQYSTSLTGGLGPSDARLDSEDLSHYKSN